VALLRDWLNQTLEFSPPLQQQLKGYLESGRTVESMSMEDLWKDLRLAFGGLTGKVFCVADALDEMDKDHDSFLKSLAALGQWKPAKVKVLMTSRPVPAVEAPLRTEKSLQMRLHEKLVDVDISLFVQKSLASSKIDPQDQAIIKEAVPGRANGLFLYAKLAMDAFLETGADVKQVCARFRATSMKCTLISCVNMVADLVYQMTFNFLSFNGSRTLHDRFVFWRYPK
jgi:hypothetical protein